MKKKVTTTTTTTVVEEEIITNDKSGVLDMVIAFDTTGSMGAYIEDVKKHVKDLIPNLLNTNPDLQLGIVAFGDYCDMQSYNNFGKAYQVINLTRNENDLIKFVQTAENTSGGDGDEFYELVLHKILNETNWRENSKKSILLIADAHPHEVGYTYGTVCPSNQIDWREEAKLAASMQVQIDTLSLYNYGEDWYKELSAMTNGIYSKFKTSSKTSDFIKAATYSRGGDNTASYMTDLYVTSVTCGDSELADVTRAYAVRNSTADKDMKTFDCSISSKFSE